MLKIGLTGGIASGKSAVATRLREHGAVLVDADALAREVVEPGTEGLRRIVSEFGDEVLGPDGRLDRPKLGALVFADPARLAALNGIVHPLVRARAAAMVDAAAVDAVVVQDIPLLVETGQGSSFHLVLVVDAPDDVRVQRMLEHRGMTREAAQARMAAQAGRQERLAAADAVLNNSGTLEELEAHVDRLWNERIEPFARNIAAGTPAARPGGPVLVSADPAWPQQAQRLMDRIRKAIPAARQDIVRLDHIGSTAVPNLDARDVIDLQLAVPHPGVADALAPALAAAGFPVMPGITAGDPKPSRLNPEDGRKRIHANADPCRPVDLHITTAGSPGWRFSLCLRDWLRAEPAAAAEYLALKRGLAAAHAGNAFTADYPAGKEDWFTAVEGPLDRWAKQSGWQPPSYVS